MEQAGEFLASSPSVLVICLGSTKLVVESVLNERYEHSCSCIVVMCWDRLTTHWVSFELYELFWKGYGMC